jgi:CheY-like chemotaxis protein
VALSISDTGIGIEADLQGRVFEAFAQADGTTARRYGGTGLGLSISRELVRLLDGEITVTSAPGKGSTFTVYLPVGAPAPALAIPASAPPAPAPRAAPVATSDVVAGTGETERDRPPSGSHHSGFRGARVLVVDDDFRNLFAMTAVLERGGAEVTLAESGTEAIATLERMPEIDIVLMDIMMPIMDGYAAIRAIRASERFNSIPIVAVTGKVMPGERERCIEAGANDFIPKPVDTAELVAVLGPWLPVAAPSTT